jgi:hypothetical protein
MKLDVTQITKTVGGYRVEFIRTIRNECGVRHLFLCDEFVRNGIPVQAHWYNDNGQLLSESSDKVICVPQFFLATPTQDPMLLQGCVAAVWMEMERA